MAVRVFLSYAHEDAAWRDAVLNHLGWLRHTDRLRVFDDREIKPGGRWNDAIKAELEAAAIVVLLISPHFTGSRYCTVEELTRAVERAGRGGVLRWCRSIRHIHRSSSGPAQVHCSDRWWSGGAPMARRNPDLPLDRSQGIIRAPGQPAGRRTP